MIVPGSVNPLLLATGGYDVPYSLRFRRSNSPYMRRTAGTPTNAKIATWSFWHKRGALGGEFVWGQITAGASTFFTFDHVSPDTIRIYVNGTNLTSTPVFRDPSAWYHFVVAVDTTQATAADRIKVYVNNQAVTMSGTITLNADITFNVSGKLLKIGDGTWFADSRDYIDGYLAEFNFIDGQALTPSSFGQTDSATGVWVPKKYSGTYGTNGFYLKFNDATSTTTIGNDSSGNANNWTTSGISVTSGVTLDQMTDTPTRNFCVLNPLIPSAANISWANLQSGTTAVRGTINALLANSYWEVTAGGSAVTAGTISDAAATNTTTVTANKVFGFRLTSAGTLDYINITDAGSWTNITSGLSGQQFPYGTTAAANWNFGQRAFDGTVPNGFYALNTTSLPIPSIKKGSLYMDATLRTGTGASASVSSLGFQPDLVWIKSRSAATSHNLFDSSRGVSNGLSSDATSGEYSDANTLTAFSSSGYSLGSDSTPRGVNVNAATYADWAWKKGTTPGFDIVEYAGNNTSNRNINHSLGVAPAFAIIRNKGATGSWFVWHRDLTSAAHYLRLENENAQSNSTTPFGTGNWSSTQFMVTNNATYNLNANSNNYIAYLFAEVEGFSKFGSYVGNASTDGPFAFCNMRPRFIMLKNASTAVTNWAMKDTARSPSNVAGVTLRANAATAEATGEDFDILSNGFKVRNTGSTYNSSGGTIVFAAFAENPFKYARAR